MNYFFHKGTDVHIVSLKSVLAGTVKIKILLRALVTADKFSDWCGDLLHICTTRHCISQITGHTRSSTSDAVFSNSCLVATSNFGHVSSSGFRNHPQPQLLRKLITASVHNDRISAPLKLAQSLTHSLTCPDFNISVFLCCSAFVGPETQSFSELLPSGDRCIVA
jgi:hypothetical protein